MNPLISIITPNYNSERFIDATIQSVLSQTYANWELLIVDDVSTDSSLAIIKKYCDLDERISLIQLNKNQGPAVSRNKGIELSKGDYIAFLDSDDRWKPSKLEKQLAFMQLGNYKLSHTAYISVDEDFNNPKTILAKPKVSYKDLLTNNYLGCLTVMYDVRKLGKVYFPLIQKRQDWALWLKITKLGIKSMGLQEPLAYYTRRTSSVSSNKVKLLSYNWKVFREIEGLSLVESSYYMSLLVLKKLVK